jgi:hypothetical protein
MKTLPRSCLEKWAICACLLTLVCVSTVKAQDTAVSSSESSLPILRAGDTEDLLKKDGQKVTVIGKCDRTEKSSGGTNFVNFENSEFSLVTFKSDLGPFTAGEPADIYEGKHLSVSGVIEIYKDAPQIKLLDPKQVRISDQAFQVPDPEMKPASPTDGDSETSAADEPDTDKPADEEEKPKPPVDPRKYFKKPATS